MKSTSIHDTTVAERIALIKSWIPDDDGFDDCGIDLWDMYDDYIKGKREIAEINASFRPDYVMEEEASPEEKRAEAERLEQEAKARERRRRGGNQVG